LAAFPFVCVPADCRLRLEVIVSTSDAMHAAIGSVNGCIGFLAGSSAEYPKRHGSARGVADEIRRGPRRGLLDSQGRHRSVRSRIGAWPGVLGRCHTFDTRKRQAAGHFFGCLLSLLDLRSVPKARTWVAADWGALNTSVRIEIDPSESLAMRIVVIAMVGPPAI
jgi:hypothetical protein